MEAKAIAQTVRIAPRKVRLVVDLIRGKQLMEAYSVLKLTEKRATKPVEKLLKSAVANATNNYNMDSNKLFIKEVFVNEGPTLKRFLPRAKGSANQILKRTSNITIIVAEKE